MGTPRRPHPPAAREAEASARTRYYAAKATETEMRNRVRAGELIEAKAAEERWGGGLVTAIRDAVLQLPGLFVQRAWAPREHEDDMAGAVEHCLRHLAAKGRHEPWTPPEAP